MHVYVHLANKRPSLLLLSWSIKIILHNIVTTDKLPKYIYQKYWEWGTPPLTFSLPPCSAQSSTNSIVIMHCYYMQKQREHFHSFMYMHDWKIWSNKFNQKVIMHSCDMIVWSNNGSLLGTGCMYIHVPHPQTGGKLLTWASVIIC